MLTTPTNLPIADALFSQGFGTRRVCAGLVQMGHVSWAGEPVADASADVDAFDGQTFTVQGQTWRYHQRAFLLMHKPKGHECSQKPSAWPSVYSLLPTPLRQRPASNKTLGVQAIGRLDQDTTGLLLFSDDGAFIHRMASPKHHVPKVYQVQCESDLSPTQVSKLLAGVRVADEPKPLLAEAAHIVADRHLALTLTEGKYHQVKRMLAAVGNGVVALHRSQMGDLQLPEDLSPGQWRWLSAAEVAGLLRP
jgi:16S rRNA pseudouridine516 synthase